MGVAPVSTAFTSARAARLAREAAAVAGLAHEGVELIRLGSSAVLRLPGGVVARVARDESWAETSAHEVRTAAALYRAGVPCVRPWPVQQPVTVGGHPVTFWAEIPGPLQRPGFDELGAVLRRLHSVHTGLDLPPLDPWERTPERVEQAPVSDHQRRVLSGVLAEVQDAWPSARFQLTAGAVHGDAHLGNLVRGADGAVVLVDWDSACTGPREWDLAPTGLYAASLGWVTAAEYQGFVAAYGGFDVTATPVFPLLARMRELRMTAWLAMHATESEQVAAEVAHRVACLADPELPRHWSAR